MLTEHGGDTQKNKIKTSDGIFSSRIHYSSYIFLSFYAQMNQFRGRLGEIDPLLRPKTCFAFFDSTLGAVSYLLAQIRSFRSVDCKLIESFAIQFKVFQFNLGFCNLI